MKTQCRGSASLRCVRAGCSVPRQCIQQIAAEVAIEHARDVVDAITSVTWPGAVLAVGLAALALAMAA